MFSKVVPWHTESCMGSYGLGTTPTPGPSSQRSGPQTRWGVQANELSSRRSPATQRLLPHPWQAIARQPGPHAHSLSATRWPTLLPELPVGRHQASQLAVPPGPG